MKHHHLVYLSLALALGSQVELVHAGPVNRLKSTTNCIGEQKNPLACALMEKAKGITLNSLIGTLGKELYRLSVNGRSPGTRQNATAAYAALLTGFGIERNPSEIPGFTASSAGNLLEDAIVQQLKVCQPPCNIVPREAVTQALTVLETDRSSNLASWQFIRQLLANL